MKKEIKSKEGNSREAYCGAKEEKGWPTEIESARGEGGRGHGDAESYAERKHGGEQRQEKGAKNYKKESTRARRVASKLMSSW